MMSFTLDLRSLAIKINYQGYSLIIPFTSKKELTIVRENSQQETSDQAFTQPCILQQLQFLKKI